MALFLGLQLVLLNPHCYYVDNKFQNKCNLLLTLVKPYDPCSKLFVEWLLLFCRACPERFDIWNEERRWRDHLRTAHQGVTPNKTRSHLLSRMLFSLTSFCKSTVVSPQVLFKVTKIEPESNCRERESSARERSYSPDHRRSRSRRSRSSSNDDSRHGTPPKAESSHGSPKAQSS